MSQLSPEFDWDAVNRYHLGRHHVFPEEAQHAIRDPHAILLAIESGNGADRTKAVGKTASGRMLAVVFTLRGEAIRPITAYVASPHLQSLYLRPRRI
ncbi:MAG TPA: BrnT family toxin [Terriglobia bacterium]|nr:BrnT family toxin [Terriglobia bacterium]